MNIFTERLRDLIEDRCITQRELAQDVGVTEVTISRYTNGGRMPRVDIIGRIAEALGASTDYLLGKEGCGKGGTVLDKKYTLKELRARSKETQQTAAKSIGVKRSTYSHYENGRRTPNINVAQRIAKHFGVSTDDIYFLNIYGSKRHNEESA